MSGRGREPNILKHVSKIDQYKDLHNFVQVKNKNHERTSNRYDHVVMKDSWLDMNRKTRKIGQLVVI